MKTNGTKTPSPSTHSLAPGSLIRLPPETLATLPPLLTTPVADLDASVDHAVATIDQLESQLTWRYQYSAPARAASNGRFRDGEAAAVTSILDAADVQPAFYLQLAARDGGSDPGIFETQPTRDHLRRRDAVARLAARLATFATTMDDSVMRVGEAIRSVASPVYDSVKLVADKHEPTRAALSDATTFYNKPAQKRRQNSTSQSHQLQKKIRALRAEQRQVLKQKIAEIEAQFAAVSPAAK